ncbi:very short patch repair endonuclease [Arthrobacter agilis]|uniref:Very short patch repair endonuclease n=1 Tax=Arthrobacter agilis TaxID=37921 RepID=A0A2L0UGN7_9MICC|nr:very short patch repair endonuclease [Arthrobacter agilis]AUZ88409.1 very short patch repair endonuclease [Arthrobacter agilis]
MADTVDAATRSRMMSGIRGKNTKGEVLIRKGLHARGLRYRINARDLPGKPDVVLPRHHAVIFFNGCFWHQHDCPLFRWPKTREDFWREKLNRNRERDLRVIEELTAKGWRIGIVWECSLRAVRPDPTALLDEVAGWVRDDLSGQDGLGQSLARVAADEQVGRQIMEQHVKEWRAPDPASARPA